MIGQSGLALFRQLSYSDIRAAVNDWPIGASIVPKTELFRTTVHDWPIGA